MSQYTEIAGKVQDTVLSTLKSVQEANVAAVATVSQTAGDVLPDLPQVPFADRLPRAEEIVETSFGFAQRLLDAQKQFAHELLKAVEPVRVKLLGYAPSANGSSPKKA